MFALQVRVDALLSGDKKFASGMYKSGKTRAEITEPYGVDEFMYFPESRKRHALELST